MRGIWSAGLVSAAFCHRENTIVLAPVRIDRANLTGDYLSIGEGPRRETILVRILRALPSADSYSSA